MVHPLAIHFAQRHHLDQRHVMPVGVRPFHEVGNLLLVEALQRHGVDLDLDASFFGSGDALQHLHQPIAAGKLLEQHAVHRVEADVDALHAGGGKLIRMARQLRAVGGEGQFFQPVAQLAAQRLHQFDHVAPHQWFAAGQADLGDAAFDERKAQLVQFLQAQHFLLGKELHRLGHAIAASEVTPVCHRKAQVGNPAVECVDKGGGTRHAPPI